MSSAPASDGKIRHELLARPRVWGVTGVAGFIGSHLLESLLDLDQTVRGLDNFSSGHKKNLSDVRGRLSEAQWNRFTFFEGDICDPAACLNSLSGCDVVLHQAAIGSVPLSLENPLATHRANVDGFVNVLEAARRSGIKRLIYASSSAVYGDDPLPQKREETIGRALSPYATSKRINELDADIYQRCFGLETVGLRYFNVFGPRQDPNGAYAAVIPRWITALLNREAVTIYGDGKTSRDFCYVRNVVQANLLAGTAPLQESRIFNIAAGVRTTLNELVGLIAGELEGMENPPPRYEPFRAGDIPHSHADITLSRKSLGYEPQYTVREGIKASIEWYKANPGFAARP